jgi:predicted lipoprotein with Yx(FWY)xxD motif
MRKSGFAAAAGLGSLVLLLTACGGSSSTSTPATTSTANPGGQATTGALNAPPPGSTVLHVQKSALGYVLALATGGQVVYTYAKDTKGGTPTCTGSCAAVWLPVTGIPQASPAATGLGTLGTVADANGAKQVTYDGMPLYTLKGEKALATKGNGGMWHVIKLSKSNITGA